MQKAGDVDFSTMPQAKNDDFIGYSPNPHLFVVENYVERVLWIQNCGKSGENFGLKRQNHLKNKEKHSKKHHILMFVRE